MKRYDLNQSGSLSPAEVRHAKEIAALEVMEETSDMQRRMGWISLASIIGFTAILFTPYIDLARVTALTGAIDMFYISLGGIVGAVVGVKAWASNSRVQTYSSYSYEESGTTGGGKYGSTD